MANATFTATFTTAGTFTWVAPAGVTSVSVQCWAGGGGGGAGHGSNTFGGGGGGGGEYAAELSNTCVAGDSYTVVVGAAGAGGNDAIGGTGGNSTFTGTSATTVTAHGGAGGNFNNGAGSGGGSGSTNSTHYSGGNGKTATATAGEGGGGSGGTASAGNAASGTSESSAVTGGGPGGNGAATGSAPSSGPGGGGGGSNGSTSGTNGAAGYAGQVVITWTMSSTATLSASTSGGVYTWTAPSGVTSVSWTISGTASFDSNTSTGSESVTPGTAYTISVGSSGSLAITWGSITSTGSVALAPLAVSGTVTVANPVTSTGSAALAPLATSGSANNGVIGSTGSVALAPMAVSGTGRAGNIGTGSVALAPLAVSGTDTETYAGTGSVALGAMAVSGSGYQAFPFPQSVLNLLFELLVGTTWTDISDYVYQRATTVITRGRADESSTGSQSPASCTFTLNNRDGRFSAKNPVSPYYGLIGKNTQFRVSAQSDVLTPDLTYRFWGEISEWPPTWDQTGNDIAVSISANGILRRLNQNAALGSTLYRYYATLTGTAMPLAWWPAEDGAQATSLASGLTRGFPMTFTGTPTLASDSGLAAASPFPAFNDAVFTGPTGVAGALPVSTTVVLSTTGTHTWQCPAGIDSVLVQAWGAGGGGSAYNGSTGGAGGGGGEYASDSIPVTAGNNYSYTVGASSAGGNGGTTTMHGDSSTSVVAHGGGAGSSDGSTGGAGGTGSTNGTHYDGGAGAAGSGGPGGGGSDTQSNQAFTSSGSWQAPSDIDGGVTAYVWGAGGGGGGGGSSSGGGGGGGGGFSSGGVSVTGGDSYTVTVGSGGSGGSSGSAGGQGGNSTFQGIVADGGSGGHATGNIGDGGSGGPYDGGNGGSGASGNKGGGGGGGASIDSGGGGGTGSVAGGGGGSGGAGNGTINGGGSGGNGGSSASGARNGSDGDATGGGGGGGYTNQFGATPSGGAGGRGKVWLFWDESGDAPDAAIGGGGGSSGGSSSAGNDGDTEAGGAAVSGGGPGGGTLAGSTFIAAPSSTPGGGGGGYDSLGNAAAGAQGLITLSYAPGGTGSPGTAANVLRFVLHVPSGGDTDGAVVAQMFTTGTVAWVSIIYNQANSGSLTMAGYTGAGAQLFTSGEVAFGCDGQYLLVSAEMTTSGSNIAWNFTGIVAGATVTAADADGTLDGASLGGPFSIVMDPAGTLTSTTFAHVAILETYDPVTDLAGPLAAYAGETAAARFGRVCTEQGIPYDVIDVGDTDTTALVGPQLPAKVVVLLQDCEDADRGLLYEPRGSFGVAYRTRNSLYQQTAAVQLDYSQQQVAYPMQPTDDDQLLRNDVTITRPSGSSSEYQVLTGPLSINDPPNGVGSYTYSATWNVDTDGQLPDLASWTAFIGTYNDLRYPVINLDLARAEIVGEFAAVVAMDIGDYLQIVNTQAPIPPGDVRQIIYGYTENFGPFGIWTLAENCVPEMPYEIAQAGAAPGDLPKCDTDGSQLHAGIGLGDTSFAVDTPTPNQPWVDSTGYPAEFPFDIVMTGERMTCTGISGTSTPQTFTVSRAVNGVQKAHNAGEAVNLYSPAIVAL